MEPILRKTTLLIFASCLLTSMQSKANEYGYQPLKKTAFIQTLVTSELKQNLRYAFDHEQDGLNLRISFYSTMKSKKVQLINNSSWPIQVSANSGPVLNLSAHGQFDLPCDANFAFAELALLTPSQTVDLHEPALCADLVVIEELGAK